MKILFITENLRSGGKERRLVELIKGISGYGDIYCELVLMSKEIFYTEIFNLDIKIHYLIRKNKKDHRIFYQLYKLCKKINPSIIHSWGSMPSVYSFSIAKILKIKFINAMIADAPNKLSFKSYIRSKFTFPFSDIILSNSNAGLKSYNVPMYKGYFIHNGFNFDRIKNMSNPIEIRQKFNITTKYVIGMVASFSNKKDYQSYIIGAQEILEYNNNVTFLCIGDGDDFYCRNLVKNNNLNNIRFLAKQTEIESIINIFDIGVLTTDLKVHGEGISNSILEYMALGKPVIATNGGGTNEIVTDGETGFLVKNKSVKEIFDKMKYLLSNERIATIMGEKGRQRIIKEFSLKKMIIEYLQLYHYL